MKKEKLKKRLLSALCVILVIVALATLVGPHLVLIGARQPDVEDSYHTANIFITVMMKSALILKIE